MYTTRNQLILRQNGASDPKWQILEEEVDLSNRVAQNALAFSPDSTRLAAASPTNDKDKVLIWNLDDPGKKPIEFTPETYLHTLLFSPDGSLLLGVGGYAEQTTFFLWDTQTWKPLRRWQVNEKWDFIAFHPDGVTLAVADQYHETLELLDLRTGAVLQILSIGRFVNDIAFSPDGRLLITCSQEKVQFWEVATGELLKTVEGSFYHVAFSPDGKLFAVGVLQNSIQNWGLPE